MRPLIRKVGAAVATIPGAKDWGRTALEAAWLIPALLLLGFSGGLMEWGWAEDPDLLLRLALVAILAPALGEELVFRAALLPAPGRRAPFWRYALPVLLFVAWHPAQVLVFGPGWARVVLDPWFLGSVALLGIALTRLYLATRSIWPGVALHWAVVVGWKAFLGGPSPWAAG